MYEKQSFIDDLLTEYNIDGLLVWRSSELVRLSNYHPHYGVSLGLYSRNDNPSLFIPALEPEFILPKDAHIQMYPWGKLIQDNPWEICFQQISQAITDKKIKKLGVFLHTSNTTLCISRAEMPSFPNNFQELISSMDCEIFNLDDYNSKFYQIKTTEDIDRIKISHKVTKLAIDTFYESLQVGETEASIASKIEGIVQQQNSKYAVGICNAWAFVQSGENTAKAGTYSYTGGRIIQKNDPVFLEMAVCVGGYWTDITRVGFAGTPTARHKELFEIIHQTQQKAISLLRPGVSSKDIDLSARNFLQEHNLDQYFTHGLGHHVGYKYHEPTGINPFSTDILEKGMIITIEPGIYLAEENFGVRVEDNILITENGYEILSNY